MKTARLDPLLGGMLGAGLGMVGGDLAGTAYNAVRTTVEDPQQAAADKSRRQNIGAILGALAGAGAGAYLGNRYELIREPSAAPTVPAGPQLRHLYAAQNSTGGGLMPGRRQLLPGEPQDYTNIPLDTLKRLTAAGLIEMPDKPYVAPLTISTP